jgi:hypothetical protein
MIPITKNQVESAKKPINKGENGTFLFFGLLMAEQRKTL